MALTIDCVSVAAGCEPSGFAAFKGRSPDGLQHSANKVNAIPAKAGTPTVIQKVVSTRVFRRVELVAVRGEWSSSAELH